MNNELNLESYWKGLSLLSPFKHSRWVIPFLLAAIFPSSVAPAQSIDNETSLTVSVTSLNVRSGPGQQYSIVGSVKKDETYPILREQNQWYEIELPKGKGWIASWMVAIKGNDEKLSDQAVRNEGTVKMINPLTNIRSGPGTNFQVLQLANKGDIFPIMKIQGDWFQIRLADGKLGYVANWIVQSEGASKHQVSSSDVLQGRTLVLDAGHGGDDGGAVGAHHGSLEKEVNLQVARILKDRLEAAGAKVVLTREDDQRVTLKERVNISTNTGADAFISIHHNTNDNASTNGEITYYYHQGKDRELAESIQKHLVDRTGLADLRARFGDYYVLRENPRLSVLCELGFLTNYQEEVIVNTRQFQEQAAEGIFQGLVDYFAKH